MHMSPFTFPDPSVQSTVTNPDTGDVWKFADGVWMIADPDDPDDNIPPSSPQFSSDELNTLMNEIALLRSDIIVLRAQLDAASLNNFLILE